MADADEDVIPQMGGANAEETDLSDETQDFRFLSILSREDAKIPKRGEKDFEPHATILQSDTLAASRQAMHTALAFQRVHPPKGHTTATYHPETNMAYSQSPKGPLFAKMGQVLSAQDDPLGNDPSRGQRVWLLPEEVLYLLERGTLDVRWPGEDALPMSLQGAYAMFIGDEIENDRGKLTLERYSVYAALKRMGYIVLRAPGWDSSGPPPDPKLCSPPAPPKRTWQAGLNPSTWYRTISPPPSPSPESLSSGPLATPHLYRSFPEIYRLLSLIPSHDPTSSPPSPPLEDDPTFRVTFHVWKPGSQTFKKSSPGEPDFRIAVVNARETSAPSLQQLAALLDATPYAPPKPDGQLYAKLRNGYRNVILAVVDQGVTSYLRVGDAGFGRERLFERMGRGGHGGKRGGGRGGRGGGGGRGRGRGRGG